jgi:hypothetical protein
MEWENFNSGSSNHPYQLPPWGSLQNCPRMRKFHRRETDMFAKKNSEVDSVQKTNPLKLKGKRLFIYVRPKPCMR